MSHNEIKIFNMNNKLSKSLSLIAAVYFTATYQAQVRDSVREKKIDEVVLIGYGGVKKSNLTSAVSTVKADAFNERPISNVAQAIQGNAAGVNVVQPSGKPGATMDVKIRGNTSITSSTSPLYVVDGVQTTDISGINTDDIVDMTILKDATSTAIYGINGSAGVVIITTKRGHANKEQVGFNAYWGISNRLNNVEVLNQEQYKSLMQEINPSYVKVAEDPMYQGINTNWNKEVFRTGFDQNYNVNYSFGNDAVKAYASLGYQGIDGIIKPAAFDRFSGKINLDAKLASWLKFNTSLGYSKTDLSNTADADNPAQLGPGGAGIVLAALTTPTFLPIWGSQVKVIPTDKDGRPLVGYLPGQYALNPYQGSWENPVSFQARTNKTWKNRFMSNFGFDVNLTKNLVFKPSVSLDIIDQNNMYFSDAFTTNYGRQNLGIGGSSNNVWQNLLYEGTLTYTYKEGKSDLTLLAGGNIRDFKWTSRSEWGDHFPSDLKAFNYDLAERKNKNYEASDLREVSGFFRAVYTFDNKYTVMGILKEQGSSALAPGHKWGFFPGVSAAWTISNENFLKDNAVISYLKLRGGWGKAGNASGIPAYSSFSLQRQSKTYPENLYSAIPQTENKDLTWETTTDKNIGLDLNLIHNRIRFTADAFRRDTKDLIMQIPLFNDFPYNANIGSLVNKGVEFSLNTSNVKTNDFSWDTSFNISFIKNRIESLNDRSIPDQAQNPSLKQNVVRFAPGLPVGAFFGYQVDHVDPATGTLIYKDANGNGYFDAADRTIIGNPNPKYTFGFTNHFNLKGVYLDVLFTGSQGNQIFNASRIDLELMNDFKNQSTNVLNRWTAPGQVTNVPKANDPDARYISDRFVEDGSYVKLKAATIGYNFKNLFKGISNVNIYVTGQNLYTWTKYTGFDPEVNAYAGTPGIIGIDYGTYPQVRTFIFGIKTNF